LAAVAFAQQGRSREQYFFIPNSAIIPSSKVNKKHPMSILTPTKLKPKINPGRNSIVKP
jgi:hypothetical protein